MIAVDLAYLGWVLIISFGVLPVMALLMIPIALLGRISQTGGELIFEITKSVLGLIHYGLRLYVAAVLILAALGIQTNRMF